MPRNGVRHQMEDVVRMTAELRGAGWLVFIWPVVWIMFGVSSFYNLIKLLCDEDNFLMLYMKDVLS